MKRSALSACVLAVLSCSAPTRAEDLPTGFAVPAGFVVVDGQSKTYDFSHEPMAYPKGGSTERIEPEGKTWANIVSNSDGVTDDEATATASVTIARDGTVLNSKLIQRSGNALADQSVEMVLRRVTFAAPLPDGAKESQRTVTIKFSVKAKRGTG